MLMATPLGDGRDARRLRRRRKQWSGRDYSRRYWSPLEVESLLLHVELLGYAWSTIAHSMRRSPDALRNKMVRLHRRHALQEKAQARRELKQIVKALGLSKPKVWGADLPALKLPGTRLRNTFRSEAVKATQPAETRAQQHCGTQQQGTL